MAGRDGGSGGGDRRQDFGEPEGGGGGHGQADKAESTSQNLAVLLKFL